MRYPILFLFCLLLQNSGQSQNELDVLPPEGRNELFHSFLLARGAKLWQDRRDSVEAVLTSLEALTERQSQLRADYLALLGDLPEKTDLNAEVVGTIQGDGFTIERLHFQSTPGHHVTAHFYLPGSGDGPFPTVLIMCGHYPAAKIVALHQRLATLFATNGIAALTVDPFSQGERYQIRNPETGNLSFVGESGTSAHSRLDVGAVLAGTSVVAHALWSNHRAMDYLYSRTDVVDTTRVGATGSSGGGSQATYLMAYDERIKVAAVNSFLMNEETLYATIGPQTASQNLSFEGAHLIDHPDYITMFAPKPMMILATTQDFFDIDATRVTRDEAIRVYTALGAPDNLGYFEEDSQHGYQVGRRQKAVEWFRKWFYDDDATTVTEPFDLTIRPVADLQVTSTGQVVTEFENEKTITDLNVAKAEGYTSHRTDFWMQNTRDSCLNKVAELIRLEDHEAVEIEDAGTIEREGYSVSKLKINSGDHVPVTGLLFVPDNLSEPAPAVVYVDGRGKDMDAGEGGILEKIFVDSGKVVLTIDVRGFGETTDNPSKNESKHGNKEHRNAVISAYIGKTLIGQRVEDIRKALDVIGARNDIDLTNVTLAGIDRAGPAVLHAAALDDRVTKTVIRQSFESWVPMVGNPTELHNMTHVVPFALKYYDLPDLVNALPAGSVEYFDEPYTFVTSTRGSLIEDQNGRLGQNFPNPTRQQTIIPYQLKKAGRVIIRVYDQAGRVSRVIDQGHRGVGPHRVSVNLEPLSNGQYFYRLWVNEVPVGTKKMIKSN